MSKVCSTRARAAAVKLFPISNVSHVRTGMRKSVGAHHPSPRRAKTTTAEQRVPCHTTHAIIIIITHQHNPALVVVVAVVFLLARKRQRSTAQTRTANDDDAAVRPFVLRVRERSQAHGLSDRDGRQWEDEEMRARASALIATQRTRKDFLSPHAAPATSAIFLYMLAMRERLYTTAPPTLLCCARMCRGTFALNESDKT